MLSKSIRKISCRCSALDRNESLFAAVPLFLEIWPSLRDVPFVLNYIDHSPTVQTALPYLSCNCSVKGASQVGMEWELGLLGACARIHEGFSRFVSSTYLDQVTKG